MKAVVIRSVFCKNCTYNRRNLYLRILLIVIFCMAVKIDTHKDPLAYIYVMIKLHQFSDNLYGTNFTELKNYLATCNAYEDPSHAKLQIIDRTII